MTSSETLRRPKDFKGLENGMEARFTIREHTYAMMLCRSGPSLLTGGVWTKPKTQYITADGDNACSR